MVFGLSSEAPQWLDLRAQYEDFSSDGASNLVPVLKGVTDADRYCVTPEGTIIAWSHEEPDDPTPVPGTFYDLLLDELAELEDRLERKRQADATA
jgi:hypothetical protein